MSRTLWSKHDKARITYATSGHRIGVRRPRPGTGTGAHRAQGRPPRDRGAGFRHAGSHRRSGHGGAEGRSHPLRPGTGDPSTARGGQRLPRAQREAAALRQTGWSSRPGPNRSCSTRCWPCATRATRCCTRTPASPCTSRSRRSWGPSPWRCRCESSNEFRVDPEEVEHLVTPRTKLLILNSPNNPCGSALTRDDCEAMADIARPPRPHGAQRRGLLGDPLRRQARQRPRFRRHGRAYRPARRLVEALCHDGLAAGLRRVPASTSWNRSPAW